MFGCVGVLLAGLTLAVVSPRSGPQAGPPIFQPGAPGTAARAISPREALELSRTTFTGDDVAFMQHMLVHHAQAVEMVALLRTRGADATVKLMGRRIAASQEAEMALMRDWLTARGQPLEMPGMAGAPGAGADSRGGGQAMHDMAGMDGMAGMDHGDHGQTGSGGEPSDVPLMPGMLSPRQMATLAAASGPAFDRLFLEGMIRHHQGALDMVARLLAGPGAAEDPLLSDFTTSVVADQSAEILRMQSILSDL